jgi:hypothetical protein
MIRCRTLRVLLFVGALVACSSGSKSASSTSTSVPGSTATSSTSPASSTKSSSLSSESIDPDSVCALVTIDDIKAAIGNDAVPTDAGPHCAWQTPDGKRVELDVSDFSTTGYSTVDEYRAGRTDPPFKPLSSPPDAFFDELLSEVTFPKGTKFVDIKITLDSGSQDFDQTSDKSAELTALQQLADSVNAKLT